MSGTLTLKLILRLAAVGLVLATLFALLARSWCVFDLFCHFRLQYALAALTLGVVAMMLRAWPLAAVLLAIALLHGWTIRALWLAETPARPVYGMPLRLAAANVRRSNPTPAAAVEWLRRADADLVLLVEARTGKWPQALADIGNLYPYRAPDGWRAGAPVILFSRYPILAYRTVTQPLDRRPYLLAKVGLTARQVAVAGVHPPSPSPGDAVDSRRRNLELDHIARTIEDAQRPLLVAGDFNTTPWSPHFRDLMQATDLRLAAAGQGYIATWPRSLWPARIPIDHVLVRGAVAVTDFSRGPAIGSDHFPVVVDLRIADR